MWYGKGPGVDRCGDVFKHANHAGTSKHGGVLLIAGDDHGAKSSTLPHQSDHEFISAVVPVLYPAGVQGISGPGRAWLRHEPLFRLLCRHEGGDRYGGVHRQRDRGSGRVKPIIPDDFPLPKAASTSVGPHAA